MTNLTKSLPVQKFNICHFSLAALLYEENGCVTDRHRDTTHEQTFILQNILGNKESHAAIYSL